MIFAIVTEIFCTALDFLLHDMEDSFIYSLNWVILGIIIDVIFLLNVLMCFFTGYYDEPKQEVVLDSKQIALLVAERCSSLCQLCIGRVWVSGST